MVYCTQFTRKRDGYSSIPAGDIEFAPLFKSLLKYVKEFSKSTGQPLKECGQAKYSNDYVTIEILAKDEPSILIAGWDKTQWTKEALLSEELVK